LEILIGTSLVIEFNNNSATIRIWHLSKRN